MPEENKQLEEIDDRLRKLEIQQATVNSRLDSEFGTGTNQGNIYRTMNGMTSDIKEIKEDLKTIFGNGKAGMCTLRQEELKRWVNERLKIIYDAPSKVYNIIWKALALIGMITSGIVFVLTYFNISIK